MVWTLDLSRLSSAYPVAAGSVHRQKRTTASRSTPLVCPSQCKHGTRVSKPGPHQVAPQTWISRPLLNKAVEAFVRVIIHECLLNDRASKTERDL